MSKIIDSLNNPIKFTDHVNFVEVTNKKGVVRRTLRTTDTTLPKGIYMLTLAGFGVLYLGISAAEKQDSRNGTKNRWYAHAQKMTGQFKGAADTVEFKKFREEAVAAGYSLDTILDHIVVRFVPLDKSNAKKIDAMETHLLMTLIAKGQCMLNGAKRVPALSKEEHDFIANNQF
jgi:hypothetical protein